MNLPSKSDLSLIIKNVIKSFTDQHHNTSAAVVNCSFDVKKGHIFTLLGPSGCGKTTTLRCIAGLEKPDSGTIFINQKIVYSDNKRVFVPPSDRGIGMVFQSYAIWPHMTVFENVAYPLLVNRRKTGLNRNQITEKVDGVLDIVGLSKLKFRSATDISGGQQQRLALARALVAEPTLLLLDEPLSNLDQKLREQLRYELKRLQREVGITMLYVTHDQHEALALSDVIAVMDHGNIVQIGKPEEIYYKPKNKFVAEFIGNSNFISGVLIDINKSKGVVRTDYGEVWEGQIGYNGCLGDKCVIVVRAEKIYPTKKSVSSNKISGKIVDIQFLGNRYLIHVLDQTNRTLIIEQSLKLDFTNEWFCESDDCWILPDNPS